MKDIDFTINKPPLGLTPKKIYYESVKQQRIEEITLAIQRYINARCEISIEWIEEYNELIKSM